MVKKITLISILLFYSSIVIAQRLQCGPLFDSSVKVSNNTRLFSFRDFEVQNLTPLQVKSLNDNLVTKLQQYRPQSHTYRASALSYSIAEKLLQVVRNNDVVGVHSREKYRNPDVEIGYCFGRATFVHLMLLKMGLQKQSLFKIWAVGPMEASGITWGFHVATVVYTNDKGWVAIDTNDYKPQTVSHWVQTYSSKSVDNKVRFYLTDAAKFSPDLARYDRVQLGLDLQQNNDAYRGYFKDMMDLLAEKSVESFGLKKLVN